MRRLLLLALCALFACDASAAKAKVGKRTWTYTVNDDGNTCTVVDVSPRKGSLKIPAELGGLTVTRIDPTTLHYTGAHTATLETTFWNSKVTALSVPAGVTEISFTNFDNCSKLRTLKVAAGNKTFSAANGAIYDKEKSKLLRVLPAKKGTFKVAASVRTIEGDAFDGSRLTAIVLPKNLEAINPYAFHGAKSVKKIAIPASVAYIGEWYAFAPRTAVSVSKDNKYYSAAGGVLFDKRKTKLLHCPSSKKGTYKVPASVTTITDAAFQDCTGLVKITLGKKLRSIGPYAFSGCSKLKSVKLPAGTKNIGDGAFYRCTSLKSLTLPASVRNLGFRFDAFVTFGNPFGNSGVKTVKVAAGNKTFAVAGGCLATKDKKTILAVPPGKTGTLKIPASVVAFESGAFDGCDKLSSVSLPNKGVSRENIPTSIKIVYRDKTPVYWITLDSNSEAYSLDGLDRYGDICYSETFFAFRGKATALPANPFFHEKGEPFLGWATTPDGPVKYKDKATVVNLAAAGRTVTLYAKWRPYATTYSFDANGGSGRMSSVSANTETYSVKAPACAFWRDGWTFDHWNTEPDDSGAWYDDGDWLTCREFDRDVAVTLYAIWSRDGSFAPAPAGASAPRSLASVLSLLGNLSVDSLGDAPWTESELDGVPCAVSGAIGGGGSSVLRAEVEGSGTLAFRWRTSSEAGRDIVFFSVDGKDAASRSGLDDDWTSVSLRIEGDGPHALSWTYAKDASGSAGDDRARLADVIWLPD